MIKHIEVEQNTEEWQLLRAPRVTASKFAVVMADPRKEPAKAKKISLRKSRAKEFAFSDPAKRYAFELAWYRVTGDDISESFTNKHMERGHEQEPLAIEEYSIQNGFVDVLPGGFWCDDDVGVSPDGLVGDGQIEAKSVIVPTHFKTLQAGVFDSKYKWQLIGNLAYTGKQWIDFVSYSHDYIDDQKLFVHRLYRSYYGSEIKKLKRKIDEFLRLRDMYIDQIIGEI